MDEEKDAAEDVADQEEEKDAGKDEGVTMTKKTGNNHGTMMATAIRLKMIPTTSGTEAEAEAGKEKEKALEAKVKGKPSKEKVKEKAREKDSRKEKVNHILPILPMPHLLQNLNLLLLTLLLKLTKVSVKDQDHIAADANLDSMTTRTAQP